MPAVGGPSAAIEQGELQALLHEEVNRLPAKYRAPVVLCYFEGRTHDEAAAALRWPVGTVRGRLARARDLLRARLTRRGLAPAARRWAGRGRHRGAGRGPRGPVRAMLRPRPGGAVRAPAVVAPADAVLTGLLAARFRSAAAAVAGLVATAVGLASVLDGGRARPRRGPDDPRGPGAAALRRPPAGPRPRAAGTSAFRHGDRANQVSYSRDDKTLVTLGWEARRLRLGRGHRPAAQAPCARDEPEGFIPPQGTLLMPPTGNGSSPWSPGPSAPGTSRRGTQVASGHPERKDRPKFARPQCRRPISGDGGHRQDFRVRARRLIRGFASGNWPPARDIAMLPAHENSVSGVALSPDGGLLASFRPNQPTASRIVLRAPNARPGDSHLGGRNGPRAAPARGTPRAGQCGGLHAGRPPQSISAGEDATALVWDVSDL